MLFGIERAGWTICKVSLLPRVPVGAHVLLWQEKRPGADVWESRTFRLERGESHRILEIWNSGLEEAKATGIILNEVLVCDGYGGRPIGPPRFPTPNP